MLLTDNKGNVTTSGNLTPNSFRIKASRKAFEILSAKLYSDPNRAIVRELSTNAADAHVAAGKKDLPFEIHLPNHLEPWFSVKDFGTGLSEDAVNTIYTTYFDSDKTSSNDQTGCLGLGSKSPFAYTDSFTLESRFNGVMTTYNAYLDENHLPAIVKMNSNPTDECNGLTIKFPVKSGDRETFRDKAEQTLIWFNPKPIVRGNHNFKYQEQNYLLKTDTFAVHKERTGRSYVVMGNVAYPIIAHEFLGYDESKIRKLVDWGVELYVNIGDVDISASREKLGYDKPTIAFLKKALNAALVELQVKLTEEVRSQPTLWKARTLLHSLRTSFQGFDIDATWMGQPIHDVVKVTHRERSVGTESISLPVASVQRVRKKSKRYGDSTVIGKDAVDSIVADGTPIYLNDERGGYAAVRRQIEENNLQAAYLISDYDVSWLVKTGIHEAAIKTSTLPKPIKIPGQRGSAQKAKVYEYVPKHSGTKWSASDYWKPVEVDVEEGGVFVEILYFGFRLKEEEGTIPPANLASYINALTAVGKPVKIYGIRPADKKYLVESDGEWSCLLDYVTETVKEMDAVYKNDLIVSQQLKELGHYKNQFLKGLSGATFKENSDFGKLVRLFREASAIDMSKIEKYKNLRQLSKMVFENVSLQAMVDKYDEVIEKYPLLKYIDTYHTLSAKNAIVQYVNMIDG